MRDCDFIFYSCLRCVAVHVGRMKWKKTGKVYTTLEFPSHENWNGGV
jgi:hypothetical protein